jgi:hypothetical protein
MKYTAIRLAVAVVTFVIGLAVAAVVHPFRGSAADEQEVLRVEREYIRANLDADTDTLREILADEFTIRTRSGGGTYKAERLELLENPQFAFDTIRTDNVRAEVSGDTAVVTGDVYIKSHKGSRASCGNYTYEREYEKRDGRWQIVSVYLRP